MARAKPFDGEPELAPGPTMDGKADNDEQALEQGKAVWTSQELAELFNTTYKRVCSEVSKVRSKKKPHWNGFVPLDKGQWKRA